MLRKNCFIYVLFITTASYSQVGVNVYIDTYSKHSYTSKEYDSLSFEAGGNILILDKRNYKDTMFTYFLFYKDYLRKDFHMFKNENLYKKIEDVGSLKDIHGEIYEWSRLAGKTIVMNFWETTCAPCIAELNDLNKLKKKYSNSNIVFIAFTSERKSLVLEFLKKHQFDWIIIPDAQKIVTHLNIQSYPTTLFIDTNQIISKVVSGASFVKDSISGKRVVDAYRQFDANLVKMLTSH